MSTTNTKPNTGRAATPEAEEARKAKIAATLKKKGIRPPVKTTAAKPQPTNKPCAKNAALSDLLPGALATQGIVNAHELADNPQALSLAGKLAAAQSDLKAATSEVGSLRARIAQSDSRVAELSREKSVIEGNLRTTRIKLENMTEECRVQRVAKEWSDNKLVKAMGALASTPWKCEHPDVISERIHGLVAGWELAKRDTEHFQGQAAKWRDSYEAQAETLGKRDDLLFKISLELGNKDEWDNAIPMVQALRRERDSFAADLSQLHTAHDQANANVGRLQAACDTLGAEVDRLIADSPRLPLWARCLAAVVALVAVAVVAHKMGFDAHAQLIGGRV